jgi:cytochrome c
MKTLGLAVLASASLVLAVDAAAQADLAKSKGCTNCHDQDKKKVGPAIKDISAKKKPAAEVVPKLKEGKGHPKVNASEDEIKSIYESWVGK